MALQYWQAKGEAHTVLTFRNGYHGDTLARCRCAIRTTQCTACGKAICQKNLFAPPRKAAWMVNGMNVIWLAFHLMAAHRHEIAAVIIEPIVQGAGGDTACYHPEWLKRIRKMCDREGILLIADEIATGFHRYRQTVCL
ncbi:aminotransferase class III-fold pyridoxal phosphate-dependent enzyme [Escherichia coli]